MEQSSRRSRHLVDGVVVVEEEMELVLSGEDVRAELVKSEEMSFRR